MKQPDRTQLKDLELPAVFPENRTRALPFADLGELPPPETDAITLLPAKKTPSRVVIVDDDKALIDSLGRSQKAFYRDSLDLRFWHPDDGTGLVEQITTWMNEDWRPDAVVIDINMDIGGRHGVHYLQDLRKQKGCAALAVVLATAEEFRDLDEGRLTKGVNLTAETPVQWLEQARMSEPETILYRKTADAVFLGRIGEHLTEWRRAARRRAWVRLLGEVAKKLDDDHNKVKEIANDIVAYAVNELNVNDAFVRWRRNDNLYVMIAAATTRESPYVDVGDEIDPKSVSLLNAILGKDREPVLKVQIDQAEAGKFVASIEGYRFLGVEMVLGNRSVGFITLLRAPDKEVFEREIDGQHLAVLARLMASALGRDSLMRDRQARLLTFANNVAKANNEKDVCEALADTLHEELHDKNDKGKTTVRLLDFGTGVLKRESIKGRQSQNADIAITDPNSIYAWCVSNNKLRRIPDVCNEKTYKDLDPVVHEEHSESCERTSSCEQNTFKCLGRRAGSELCVPLTIGDHALGAVNNEYRKHNYYRGHDVAFVQAAAGLAASAIERIRTTRMLDGMTDFVHRFALEETEDLDLRLRKLLYEFCGYSVLVDLEISDADPWIVRDLECEFRDASKEDLRNQIEKSYADNWDNAWVNKMYREKNWDNDWAEYTTNATEFLPVILARGGDKEYPQQADALLWLRRGEAPPHRALLLMWYLPPPMNDAGIKLLKSLARLFSELDSRKQHVKDLVEKILIGEQAAQIGYIMQHFRHRLGNLTGSMSTHIGRLETAYQLRDENRFTQAMEDLQNNAREIANSFHKSKGYVKKPEESYVLLQDLINKARTTEGLAERLESTVLHLDQPDNLYVWTDVDIASLVLYSLMENALDAVREQQSQQISITAAIRGSKTVLSISDNGPGVAGSVRSKLFEWGTTTKSDGLGSALAFARFRMRVLHGDLLFPSQQPSVGALFEIHFPTKSQELSS